MGGEVSKWVEGCQDGLRGVRRDEGCPQGLRGVQMDRLASRGRIKGYVNRCQEG